MDKQAMKWNLQLFAEEMDVEIVDDDLEPEPEVIVKEENTPLDRAAWANVVSLMETQNAVLNTSLSDLRAAVEEMRASKTASEELLMKATRKLEELEEKRLQPQETDTGSEEGKPSEDLAEEVTSQKKASKYSRHRK